MKASIVVDRVPLRLIIVIYAKLLGQAFWSSFGRNGMPLQSTVQAPQSKSLVALSVERSSRLYDRSCVYLADKMPNE